MGELAQVLKNKETSGKKAVHTWASDSDLKGMTIHMPLVYDIRKSFPEIFFPGKDMKASLGFTTGEVLVHYVAICRLAARLMSIEKGPAGAVRRTEFMKRLENVPQVYYICVTWGRTNKLSHDDAFYLALELHLLPGEANDSPC